MKVINLVMCFLLTNAINAQDFDGIIQSMEGAFTWEMWKEDRTEPVRTGKRTAIYGVDSLNLSVSESFDDSDILMNGLLGFNPADSVFYAISVFNIDPGPHIMRGKIDGRNKIRFIEERTDIVNFVEIENPNRHIWTSYSLQGNGEYRQNDLTIIFERIQ